MRGRGSRSREEFILLQCSHTVDSRRLQWRGTFLKCPTCQAKTREAYSPHELELSSMQRLVLGIVAQALHDLTAPRILLRRKRRMIAQTGLPPKRFAFSYGIAHDLARDAKEFLLHGLWEDDCPYRHVLLESDGIPLMTKARMAALVRERMAHA